MIKFLLNKNATYKISKFSLFILPITFASFSINAQIINTAAGNGTTGFAGDGGQATAAELSQPVAICFDAMGNMYFSDYGNNRIRKVNTSGVISTVAGNGNSGFGGDGGPATAATLNNPMGVSVDAAGNLFIADSYNDRIRMVNTSGIISTFAGNGLPGFSGDGASATLAKLYEPTGVCADASGNIYIADNNNNRIRKVNFSGVISTIAGNGTAGFFGDGGLATAAELHYPYEVYLDANNEIFIADYSNNRIRKIDAQGIISTVAGNGTAGYAGDGNLATIAEINMPQGVTTDAAGNIYIADFFNHRIRKVDNAGTIHTTAGNGTGGYSGDGGLATAAELYYPTGVRLDANGKIYIADSFNDRVRSIVTNVGINENNFANSFSVSPNPADDKFTVTQNKLINSELIIELYDMLGNKVYSKSVSGTAYNVETKNLPQGFYELKIVNSNKVASFIKMEVIH